MARSKSNRKQTPDANEILLNELKEIYSAESQLTKALPRMAKVIESDRLRQKLEQRLDRAERLLEELDKAFDSLSGSPGRKRNVAAEGLIGDAREHVQEIESGPALDTLLAGAMQKTEHYCLAAWGTARALAEAVGQDQVAKSMIRAVEEGKAFDAELTGLAQAEITPALLSMSEGAEDTEEEEQHAPAASRKSSSSHSGRHASH